MLSKMQGMQHFGAKAMRPPTLVLALSMICTCKPPASSQTTSLRAQLPTVEDFARDSAELDNAMRSMREGLNSLRTAAQDAEAFALTSDDNGAYAQDMAETLQILASLDLPEVVDPGPLDSGDGSQIITDAAHREIFSRITFDAQNAPDPRTSRDGASLTGASSGFPMSIDDLTPEQYRAWVSPSLLDQALGLFKPSISSPEDRSSLALTSAAGLSLADCVPTETPTDVDQNFRNQTRQIIATHKKASETIDRLQKSLKRAKTNAAAQVIGESLKVAQETASKATQLFARTMMPVMSFTVGRIVPVLGAAAQLAGIGIGIAEAVNTKKDGGSDAAAAADVLSGLGLAGAIPAVLACANCSPAEKAAAFFKGFFGIDFTARANCREGFEPIGCCLCRKIGCPTAYKDLAATCHREMRTVDSVYTGADCRGDICALTTGRGCRKCPDDAKDWVFRGCYCELPPHSFSKESYTP